MLLSRGVAAAGVLLASMAVVVVPPVLVAGLELAQVVDDVAGQREEDSGRSELFFGLLRVSSVRTSARHVESEREETVGRERRKSGCFFSAPGRWGSADAVWEEGG